MNVKGERMPELHTHRLHLRLPTLADSAAVVRLMTPEISARLASWSPKLDVDTAAARIACSLAEYQAGDSMPLMICRREGGEVLGWIGSRRHQQAARLAVLTFWMGEAYHGQGLMREAAPAALANTFTCLGVDQTQAAVQSDNQRSRAVLRALGMRMIELGSIWCDSRNRSEFCEWWSIDRAALTGEQSRDRMPASLQDRPSSAASAPLARAEFPGSG